MSKRPDAPVWQMVRNGAIAGIILFAAKWYYHDKVQNDAENQAKSYELIESGWEVLPQEIGSAEFGEVEKQTDDWVNAGFERTSAGYRTLYAKTVIGNIFREDGESEIEVKISSPRDRSITIGRNIPIHQEREVSTDIDSAILAQLLQLFPTATMEMLLRLKVEVDPEILVGVSPNPGSERFAVTLSDLQLIDTNVVGVDLPPLHDWRAGADPYPQYWVRAEDEDGNVTYYVNTAGQ